jgi:hypothetical protein
MTIRPGRSPRPQGQGAAPGVLKEGPAPLPTVFPVPAPAWVAPPSGPALGPLCVPPPLCSDPAIGLAAPVAAWPAGGGAEAAGDVASQLARPSGRLSASVMKDQVLSIVGLSELMDGHLGCDRSTIQGVRRFVRIIPARAPGPWRLSQRKGTLLSPVVLVLFTPAIERGRTHADADDTARQRGGEPLEHRHGCPVRPSAADRPPRRPSGAGGRGKAYNWGNSRRICGHPAQRGRAR